jgi:hypothetical protein
MEVSGAKPHYVFGEASVGMPSPVLWLQKVS